MSDGSYGGFAPAGTGTYSAWHGRPTRAARVLPHALCNSTKLGFESRRKTMTLTTILLIVLILMLIGAIPSWPYSRNWGYGPSGGIGLVVVILVVLLLMGRI
jgi:hypothetical protein